MYSKSKSKPKSKYAGTTLSPAAASKLLRAMSGGAYPRTHIPKSIGAGYLLGDIRRKRFTGELKCVDYPVSASAPAAAVIDTTGAFYLQNGVQTGSAFYNRVGNEIEMKSLHITGNISLSGNVGGGSENFLRIMVVYDRQTNGAYPAQADLISNYDNAGANYSNSFGFVNPNNMERFLVLMDDRIHVVDDNTATATLNAVAAITDYKRNEVNINRFIKLRGLLTKYKTSSNPAVVGDITTGGLYVFVLGNIAAASAAFQFNWQSRLRYRDQ